MRRARASSSLGGAEDLVEDRHLARVDARRAAQADGARLQRDPAKRVEVAPVRDHGHEPEREAAGGARRDDDLEARHRVAGAARLDPRGDREVGRAEADRDDPRMRCCDRGRVEQSRRVLDAREEERVPVRKAAFPLHLVDDLRDRRHVCCGLELREDEATNVRADGRLDVAHGEPPRPVDADEHVGARLTDGRGCVGDQSARAFLLRRRDAVLELEDQRVGAAGVRLRDEPLRGHGDVEHRAPERLDYGQDGQITPSLVNCARSASLTPSSLKISALCSPSPGAARRIAPGVPDRRGTTLCSTTPSSISTIVSRAR